MNFINDSHYSRSDFQYISQNNWTEQNSQLHTNPSLVNGNCSVFLPNCLERKFPSITQEQQPNLSPISYNVAGCVHVCLCPPPVLSKRTFIKKFSPPPPHLACENNLTLLIKFRYHFHRLIPSLNLLLDSGVWVVGWLVVEQENRGKLNLKFCKLWTTIFIQLTYESSWHVAVVLT